MCALLHTSSSTHTTSHKDVGKIQNTGETCKRLPDCRLRDVAFSVSSQIKGYIIHHTHTQYEPNTHAIRNPQYLRNTRQAWTRWLRILRMIPSLNRSVTQLHRSTITITISKTARRECNDDNKKEWDQSISHTKHQTSNMSVPRISMQPGHPKQSQLEALGLLAASGSGRQTVTGMPGVSYHRLPRWPCIVYISSSMVPIPYHRGHV